MASTPERRCEDGPVPDLEAELARCRRRLAALDTERVLLEREIAYLERVVPAWKEAVEEAAREGARAGFPGD